MSRGKQKWTNITFTYCIHFKDILRFHALSRNKYGKEKLIRNRPVEEAKKIKFYKRLIYKQLFQVSGFCGPQFLSYLPKRFTQLCRAFHGEAILEDSFGPPIWPLEINKNLWSSLFLQNSFFSLDS